MDLALWCSNLSTGTTLPLQIESPKDVSEHFEMET
jgi:hypothetical protein